MVIQMPKQREPIELLLAKNKKHLSKREIQERKDSELKVEIKKENIIAPEYLTQKQKDEFYKIANKLIDIGIMTELDIDCLSRYIIAKQLYLKYTSLLTKKINTADILNIEKYVNMQDKFYKQCRSAAGDLGLTITSRCRLVMPQPKEIPKENKFSKFKVINN